jgi:hypothetical protein
MPHRYVCDVLEEMRSCHKTRNFSPILGLVEEVQTMVNRLEAALNEKSDYEAWHKRVKKEKAELKKLLAETNKLRKKKDKKEMPQYP